MKFKTVIVNMLLKKLSCTISISVVMTILYSVDTIAFQERLRWLALGDEIEAEAVSSGMIKVNNYNVSFPVSTMAQITHVTKNGMRINAIIASSCNMQGYVSLESGGLEQTHVTIRYSTENDDEDGGPTVQGNEDLLYVFVQSYNIEQLIINGNLAKTHSQTIVDNNISNWTNEILQQVNKNRSG